MKQPNTMLNRCNMRVYVDLKFDHKHLLVFFRKNIKIEIKSCMFPVFLPLFRASGGCFRQSSAQHLWLPSCHVLKRWEGRKARFKFGQPTLAAQLEMLTKTNVQRFLTNFFGGVFGRARRYLDWLCSVALCCILLSALYCVVLCCDVMCRDVSYLLLYFVGLNDLMQQLDGRTTVRPTQGLNKQNFHCIFFTGKHRFLREIFIITTFCAFSCPG